MDRRAVESREYKLLLRASRFAGDRSALLRTAAAFWRDFCAEIRPMVLRSEGNLSSIETERLVKFFDTPERRFQSSSYICRERRRVADGAREVTLKFRHPDRYVSQHRRLDVSNEAHGRTKFEEDIKKPFASQFSMSTTVPIRSDAAFGTVADVEGVFPDFADRLDGARKRERLLPVNDFTARELVVEGGSFRIGDDPKIDAESALIVWYDHRRENGGPVVVEFSYRYGDRHEEYGGKMTRRAYDIFAVLQNNGLSAWVEPKAQTKTAFVYS
jgi:hypothetical protein